MGTDVSKWADKSMYTAEESRAEDGIKSYLLGAPVDPLGQIAACAFMYEGRVIRDLADVTEKDRLRFLKEIQKTVLKMPLESVSFHFMVEGLHRGITHQMVRQRTAAYAQESTRFAVKEDAKSAVAVPPSLADVPTLTEKVEQLTLQYTGQGLSFSHNDVVERAWQDATQIERARWRWDQAVADMGDAYLDMVNAGVPAEDARGILPTNLRTRLNYITNLRSFLDTIAVRVSDQAQFEWREVAMSYALAMREYGATHRYRVWIDYDDVDWGYDNILIEEFVPVEDSVDTPRKRALVERSSEWQYNALTAEMKPIEFKIGGPAFGADFDRASRIGERVRAFHRMGVPSDRWLDGAPEYNIPAISPDEWLLDPNSARLAAGEEFDIYGRRVPVGSGEHWQIILDEESGAVKGYGIAAGVPAFKE